MCYGAYRHNCLQNIDLLIPTWYIIPYHHIFEGQLLECFLRWFWRASNERMREEKSGSGDIIFVCCWRNSVLVRFIARNRWVMLQQSVHCVWKFPYWLCKKFIWKYSTANIGKNGTDRTLLFGVSYTNRETPYFELTFTAQVEYNIYLGLCITLFERIGMHKNVSDLYQFLWWFFVMEW